MFHMSLLLFNFAPSQTWIQVVLLVIGIVAVVKSAGWLTDGSVGIATRMGVPQIVIGLTVVAMGTSMPEFFVSLMSALGGKPGLAVGNVVGSNIFNASLIVGVAALVAPITILPGTVKRDIPFALVASVVLLMLCLDGNISRVDAAILFVLFLVFMYQTLQEAKKGMKADKDSLEQPVNIGVGKSSLLIVIGLVGLIVGSEVFVDNASALAHSLGVSDAVIGLTIVVYERGIHTKRRC